ncbi:hypothetical protein BOX15_Mlig000410g1 [Macrostomum lignano]|uniref:Protein phosphatase 1 regulatory subunit 42 n=1 Tax=Macrostomum lignano TaxID=282301 RepID=A0A267FVR7_9PLAT|nr:hypothetical protein BOX15_Mlig000410g1 [Macrostomum lignano]
MVLVTLELMARASTGFHKKRHDETLEQFARRVTHLYLENKSIDDVGDDISQCRSLLVLYLYDNELLTVPQLHGNAALTHLYLQNNRIRKLDHLHLLPRLTKLYLGGNQLTVVEGLERLQSLQELHVENQRLPPGEKLLFDPRSLLSLGSCLQVLCVSGNSIDDLVQFECLSQLVQFLCSDNQVSDFVDLTVCLRSWRYLKRLELSGSPVCQAKKYRDRVVVLSDSLGQLDGKEIADSSRTFLRRMQESKERRRDSSNPTSAGTDGLLPGQPRPQQPPPAGQEAPPGHLLLPSLPSRHFDAFVQKSATAGTAEGGGAKRSQSEKKSSPIRLIAM